MSYGTFFNRVGNVCLYNGAVVTGLQYPLVNCGAALLSTVAGANWQTLANKIGITGDDNPTHTLATSLTLTSVTTGMLLKAGFAAVPGLQLASFTLGVSCKLIGWYLNNLEAAPLALEEKKQEAVLPEAKKAVASVKVENPDNPLKKALPLTTVTPQSLYAKQRSAARKRALKAHREQACHLTRRAFR